ncbi:MAG: chemotaxis protein MotB [Kiritimatiellia bacterium]|jgi:chemotaxis protein MotB
MARKEKKEAEGPPGVPPWMATFSDLVTLLLTFFVMLMAMATFDDPSKVNALFASLHQQMGSEGFDPDMLGTANGEFMSHQDSAEMALSPLLARLRAAMREHLSNSIIQATSKESELRVDFGEGAFFRPGSADVHPGGYGLISDVASALASEPSITVNVRGYAADGEIMQEEELAADRAVAVITRLRNKVPGGRITASAFGHELTPSTDASKHRRIGFIFRTQAPSARGSMHNLSDHEESNARGR